MKDYIVFNADKTPLRYGSCMDAVLELQADKSKGEVFVNCAVTVDNCELIGINNPPVNTIKTLRPSQQRANITEDQYTKMQATIESLQKQVDKLSK